MPPSVEELASRLKKRNTDEENEMTVRLKEAGREIDAAEEYDYLVVNEELDKATEEVAAIINNERNIRKKR
jgi:guanylate kinase